VGMGDEARRIDEQNRAARDQLLLRQNEAVNRWKRDVASLAVEFASEARKARIPFDVRRRRRGYWVVDVPTYDSSDYWRSHTIAIGEGGDLARAWRMPATLGSRGSDRYSITQWEDPDLSDESATADKERIRATMVDVLARRMSEQS